MNKQEFDALIKEDRYQVFLFICPANMPFSFARHPWFVINKKGEVDRFGKGREVSKGRFEVFQEIRKMPMSWGHVHKNSLLPWQGIEVFLFPTRYYWNSILRDSIEGSEGSIAHRMVDFIEHSGEKYPYSQKYGLLGPNSNTYVQWILDQFPESGMTLPWNSIGKNFQRRSDSPSA